MILALLGAAVASVFAVIGDTLAAILPADAWNTAINTASDWFFIIPPGFAASVPVVISGYLALGGFRMLLNLVGRR